MNTNMQSTPPKLSIITVNLNNSDGLRLTIESIVTQQWKEFEFIVIDGGSTDGSVEVIHEFSDHINYWVSEPDSGIYNAMNKGIAVATGEYCLFLNSGDYFFSPDTLKSIDSLSLNFDIYYGDVYLVNHKGKTLFSPGPAESDLSAAFFVTGHIPHQACFIKRSLLSEGYRTDLKIASDWAFILKSVIIENASVCHINIPVVFFNLNGISNHSSNQTVVLQERKKVICETFPFTAREVLLCSELQPLIRTRAVRWAIAIDKFLMKWRTTLATFRGRNFYRPTR